MGIRPITKGHAAPRGISRNPNLRCIRFVLALLTVVIPALTVIAGNAPKAPTALRASTISPFEIQLSWSDKSSNEDGFKIERARIGGKFEQIAQLLPGTTTYRHQNLFPGEFNFYRVRAFNASGNSSYSSVAVGFTTRPTCPLFVNQWQNQLDLPAKELTDVVAIASGGDYNHVVLRRNGTVYGWGNEEIAIPTNLTQVTAISAGYSHNLALRRNGTVFGWGNGSDGQASPPTYLTGVVAIAAGGRHSLALKNDGTVAGWGANDYGQISPPANLRGVVAIAAGYNHSLALKSDGTVVGWGDDSYGQATPPDDLTGVRAIVARSSYSMALKNNGSVVVWNADHYVAQVMPPDLTNAAAISGADFAGIALNRDGTVTDWGIRSIPSDPSGVVAVSDANYGALTLSTSPNSPSWMLAKAIARNRVALSWRDSTGGGAGYQIERAAYAYWPDEPVWKTIGTVRAGVTNFADTKVPTNGVYLYQVRAQTVCTKSPIAKQVIVNIAPPTAPSGPYIYAVADKVTLIWYDNLQGASAWAIERAPDVDGSPGTWTEIDTIPVTEPSTGQYVDRGLKLGTYWYRVRSVNAFGKSEPSYAGFVNIVLPAAPFGLSAALGNTNHVELSWYNPDPLDLLGYRIERAPEIDGQLGDWMQIGTTVTSNRYPSFTDSNALANAVYWYRVKAFDVLGESDYGEAARIEILPSYPPYVTAEGVADTVTLHSVAGSYEQIAFERANDVNGDPGPWREIGRRNGPGDVEFQDHGLSAEKAYWYRARTLNWVGPSDYSDPISVYIHLPYEPSFLNAVIGISNQVNIYWNYYDTDADAFLVQRAIETNGYVGPWSEIGQVPQSPFIDTNVVAHAIYLYRVQTSNHLGTSAFTYPVRLVIEPPQKPELTAQQAGTEVQLDWNPDFEGAMGFRIHRAPDTNGVPGNWTEIVSIAPVWSPYYGGFRDTNATPNVLYWYRLQAFNWAGESPFSDLVSAGAFPPPKPTNVWVRVGPTNCALISYGRLGLWQDINNVKIERSADVGGIPGAWSQIPVVPIDGVGGLYPPVYQDANVIAGASYWYRLRTFNDVGDSLPSDPVQLNVTLPNVGLNLATGLSRNKVHLQWSLTTSDYGDAFVGGVEIERALDNGGVPGNWAHLANTGPDTVRASWDPWDYIDTGVAGATYWYRVRILSWVGASLFCQPVSVTIIPPPIPERVQAYIGRSNAVDLAWYSPEPNDQDGFNVESAPDVNGVPGVWEQIGTIPATNYYYASWSDTNVVANTTNWYRIRSFGIAGNSDFSSPIRIAIVPPPAPEYINASQFADHADVRWGEFWPYEYPGYVQGAVIERAPDFSGSPGTWTQIGTVQYTLLHADGMFDDSNLTANATYWYRVRAYNWVGIGSATTPVSVTILPPAPPVALRGLPGNTNEVRLEWAISAPFDAAGFRIERAPDISGSPGAWSEIGQTEGSDYTYVDAGVTANTTNWYRVRAFNAVGTSSYCPPTSVALVPPPAPFQFLPQIFVNRITLIWSPNFEGHIDGFKIERMRQLGDETVPWTEIAVVSNTFVGGYFHYVDSNLAGGATYSYRIRQFNWLGESPYSNPWGILVSLPRQPRLGGYMFGFTNLVGLDCYVDLQEQDGFKFERAPDIGGSPGTWIQFATKYETNTWDAHVDDTNVVAYTTNWYRARVFNVLGDSPYTDPVRVRIMPPSKPTLGTFTNSLGARYLTWSVPAETGSILEFTLERAPDTHGVPGSWSHFDTLPFYYFNSPDSIDSNSKYWYRIRGTNWIAASPYSEPLFVDAKPTVSSTDLTLESAPVRISAVTRAGNDVVITWSSPDRATTVVEATPDLTLPFKTISPVVVVPGNSQTATFVDSGGATNSIRFYRIRKMP